MFSTQKHNNNDPKLYHLKNLDPKKQVGWFINFINLQKSIYQYNPLNLKNGFEITWMKVKMLPIKSFHLIAHVCKSLARYCIDIVHSKSSFKNG